MAAKEKPAPEVVLEAGVFGPASADVKFEDVPQSDGDPEN